MEAEMIRIGADGDPVDTVQIPLTDYDSYLPVVLHTPLPEFSGVWHLESLVNERPARYVQVEP